MRLRTRVTAAVVTVSTIGTLMLGGLTISEVRNSRIGEVDRALLEAATRIASSPSDPVAAGLLAVDRSALPIALGFSAHGAGFTWLRDLTDIALPTPSNAQLQDAADGPDQIAGEFRMTAVKLADGATLVVAAPTADIDAQTGTDIAFLAAFWVLLSLIMGFIIRVLVRRDTRDIERLVALAADVAGGAEVDAVPQRARSAEVAALADALRRMVSTLQAAVRTEQAANLRMQAFLGDASHELRTPLTVVKGYLELLERDVSTEQRERALHRMRTETARMEMLINDLLLLAEIGSPAPADFEPVELSGVVRTAVDDLRVLQPERPIEAELATSGAVHAVAAHAQRAVGNAFANIRRHTAPTDPVRVSLRSDGATALLVIEDGGPGLSDDMYERGIAHFQRFDRSRSRGTGGSGLGMSIIAAVMQETGGAVHIGPSELGGLRMELQFPHAS